MIPSLWELVNFSLRRFEVPIIWSYQNAARLPKQYIMVNYSSVATPEQDEYGPIDKETETRVLRSHRRATAELQFFCGHESYPLASRASMLLTNNAALEKACQLDVAVGPRTMLHHVPALLNNSQYEDRAILQFDFNYTDTLEEDVTLIDEIRFDGGFVYDFSEDPRIRCRETIRVPKSPQTKGADAAGPV